MKELAPGDSEYWQLTVRFLDLVQENWPAILEGEGVLDPPTRRNLLLGTAMRALAIDTTAGSGDCGGLDGLGSASADLIALVAGLPRGMVVLPGLDRDADTATWDEIAKDESHPQFGLRQLLNRLEVAPKRRGVLAERRLHRRAAASRAHRGRRVVAGRGDGKLGEAREAKHRRCSRESTRSNKRGATWQESIARPSRRKRA